MRAHDREPSDLPLAAAVADLRGYAVFALDGAGVITSWNAGVGVLLGFEEHEFVGRPGAIVFTPEDRAGGADAAEIAAAREWGEARDDRWHVRRDGSRVWVNGVLHAVRTRSGEVVGFLKVMRDQTEKRAAEVRLEEQRSLLDAVLDSLPGAFYMYDGERYVRWNREVERVTGFSATELTSASPTDLVLEGRQVLEHVDEVFRHGQRSVELHVRTKSGALVPYLFTSQRVVLNEQPLVLGLGVDVREQALARQALERFALEQSAIAELAAYSLPATDVRPVLELAAERVAETLGASHVRIVELTEAGPVTRAVAGSPEPLSRAAPGPPGAAGDAVAAGRTGAGNGRDPASSAGADAGAVGASETSAGAGEAPARPAAAAEVQAIPASVLPAVGLGSGVRARIRGHGGSYGYVEVLSVMPDAFSPDDLTFLNSVAFLLAGAIEKQRLQRELERRAENDDLTGLLNRRAFEDRLAAALGRAERQGTRVAVLFLDLDGFKEVNDTLGHQAGDEVLVEVARRVREVVRSWDVVARHGGDEFVLFLPDIASRGEVTHVAERLLEAFRAPFAAAGEVVAVGTTVGIATYPDDGRTAQRLLNAADDAMYLGKANGKSGFIFFGSAPEAG